MFLVGGGILVHGLPFLHHLLEALPHAPEGIAAVVVPLLFNAISGIVAGMIALTAMTIIDRLRRD